MKLERYCTCGAVLKVSGGDKTKILASWYSQHDGEGHADCGAAGAEATRMGTGTGMGRESRRQERRKKAGELLGGPLTPEELAGDYVVRHMPDDRQKAQEARSEAQSEPPAPMLDIPGVRRTAEEGRPVDPRVVLSLCDEVDRWRRQASLWADNIADLTRERDDLLSAGQAWARAIEKQDIAAIERAEHALIAAIGRLS